MDCKEKAERIAKARDLKATKTCSQAVALAFGDLTGLDAATLERATIGFSGGMCTAKGTCGALTGAALVAGLRLGASPGARAAVAETMQRFEQRNGSTICHELKGVQTGRPLRGCAGCCADAAEFLADALDKAAGKASICKF